MDPGVTLIELDSYRDLKPGQAQRLVHPTSRPFLELSKSLGFEILPARGFCSSFEQFESAIGKRLRLEDFYRNQRRRLNVLMRGQEPEGDQWNFDHENRKSPPKSGLGLPYFEIVEDELDQRVRATLDALEKSGKAKFIGRDGPRKAPGSHQEALLALEHFIEHRLPLFGPYEDAVLEDEWVMAHSMLSAAMNLGLLDPLYVVERVEAAYRSGFAPIESAEGFIRQVIGWRDYVWHLYWRFGEEYLDSNFLDATGEIPVGWLDPSPEVTEARCVSESLRAVRDNAWAHHIQRLMILGNVALQAGFNPRQTNDWFVDAFIDGTPWVMPANVIGMTLFADGGRMSTKPYAASGSYINRMTNHCRSCKFDPSVRVGEKACPITAGYWSFLEGSRKQLGGNHRLAQSYANLDRLKDITETLAQHRSRDWL